jgi:hypothetical protein
MGERVEKGWRGEAEPYPELGVNGTGRGLFGNSGEEAGFGDHHEAREWFVDMP